MRYPFLITSDLHLTANHRDEYRWGVFPWLAEQCKKHSVKTLLVLGDLTDAKDLHPAVLVNRITDSLEMVAKVVDEIVILMGNHDWLKENEPFFSFLSMHPKIKFVSQITVIGGSLFLPYTKDPIASWKNINFNGYPFVFTHQTVSGAVSENGQKMSSTLRFKTTSKIYSGDIHVPQQISGVEYIGAPYPIKFGDGFKARCVLVSAASETDLYYPTIKRAMLDITSISQLERSGLGEGDQAKIRMRVGARERPLWDTIRKDLLTTAKEMGIDVVGLEMQALPSRRQLHSNDNTHRNFQTSGTDTGRLLQFSDEQDLPSSITEAGLDVLEK